MQRSLIIGSARGTVSVGGSHGPVLLGKLAAGEGGGVTHGPIDLLIPTLSYREIITSGQDFLHRACKKSHAISINLKSVVFIHVLLSVVLG